MSPSQGSVTTSTNGNSGAGTTTTVPGVTSTSSVTTTVPGATSTSGVTTTTVTGNTPPAPTLSLATQSIKTFRFTWSDVAGESEYRLLEQLDAGAGFVQVATIAANTGSYDLPAFLPRRVNAQYVLQACNASGCANSAAVAVSNNLAAAAGYVKASNPEADDWFGFSVALTADGNTLAIGAYLEDSGATGVNGNQASNTAFNSGAVYVYTRSGNIWVQQAYIKASNTGAGDWFGYSVALAGNGNTLAVGAPFESSAATGINGNQLNNDALDSGAVYVFTRNGTAWSQQAYVKASNTNTGDAFGISVALSSDGNTLAAGAANEASSATGINGNQNNNNAFDSGAVYVFTRGGTAWSQQAYIKASNTGEGDAFGATIALSGDGNTLAVGAYNEDSSATGIQGNQNNELATDSGAVYVFIRNGSNWTQQAYIKASNTESMDWFGYSLALSADGNTLAVGAYGEDSAASGVNGNQTDNSSAESGAVYVFSRNGGAWSQQAYIKASNTNSLDWFGTGVALSADGNTLIVGAAGEDGGSVGINGNQADNGTGDSGAAYVFVRSGVTWTQRAYIKAPNPGAGDMFGMSVAISADGSTAAVGAYNEDSGAAGINGNQASNTASNSGAVYLY
ncbi:integrin [Paucimonas lemoignei]|uniref:integrin n=1 Tax=Paucimonas lemoignei TaxID=29443 RepID=UPI001A9DE1B0|nr:integrin [Paucimonas lemoignei]